MNAYVKYSSIIYTRQLLQNFLSFGPRHKQWGTVSPTQSWKRRFSSSKKGSFLFCCVPLMVEFPEETEKKNSTHFFLPTLVGWDIFFGGFKKNHPRNTAKTWKKKRWLNIRWWWDRLEPNSNNGPKEKAEYKGHFFHRMERSLSPYLKCLFLCSFFQPK